MAQPEREVIVMVGDGSYLMMNSEIATSVMLGRKLIVVVLDNRGYGCINRLQQACGGAPFNNLLDDCVQGAPARRASTSRRMRASLGALAEHVATIAELEAAMAARPRGRSHLRDLHRHRSCAHHRRRRLVVGGGGAGSVGRAAARCARRAQASSYEARRAASEGTNASIA